MSRLLLVALCALYFTSCERERVVEVEVEREFSWKANEEFNFDNRLQMNSRVAGDLMFFLGHTFFTCITADASGHPGLSDQSLVPYLIRLTPPANQKPPIGKDFHVLYANNGLVRFVPNLNPVSQGAAFDLRLGDLDEDFRFLEGMVYGRGESIVINDQNQVLIPYADSTTEVRMALVDMSYEPDNVQLRHNLDTVRTQIISIDLPVENFVVAMESIGDRFFITTDNKVFRMESTGQYREVLDQRLYKYFEIDNFLIGVGLNNLFISADEGLSWTPRSGLDLPVDINFTRIGDRVVAYRFAQLWEVVLENDELSFTELDNDGLDGLSITSVNLFGDQVYVTSLSGVYNKSLAEFFVAKEVEGP